MKIGILELSKNLRHVIAALQRRAIAVLSKHRRDVTFSIPAGQTSETEIIRNSPAFGMWKEREDMEDPAEYVRRMRSGRSDDR